MNGGEVGAAWEPGHGSPPELKRKLKGFCFEGHWHGHASCMHDT